MKLSEAIRKGVKHSPIQGYFQVFDGQHLDALGGAMAALGWTPSQVREDVFAGYRLLEAHYPQLLTRWENPCSGNSYNQLWYVICVLNDAENKSREWIADWLEKEHNL